MTKRRSETPAKKAKRVRFSDNDNEVQVTHVETPDTAPSIAARDHVKAAVASHPEAIQRIAATLSKEFVSLKAKFLQKSNTKTKLDGDSTFIPRSAKVAFKLTAPTSIMETNEFKLLSAAMDDKTREYSEFCKKSIASVAALVHDEMKKEITAIFRKGLLQLATMLLIQQDPKRKEQPVNYFMLFSLCDMDQAIFDSTHATKLAMQTELMTKINEESDTPATQQSVEIPVNLQGPFALLRPILHALLAIVFVESFAKYNMKISENETKKCLEKQATQFLAGDATAAAAMEVDAEPSADPKILRDLITKTVQEKTSKLATEVQRLRDSVKRTPEPKNSGRGAHSSSDKRSASSPNKNGKREKKQQNSKNDEQKNKPNTPRKNTANSDVRNEKGSQKGNKNKKKTNGTPLKKTNAKKQQSRAKQS